MDTTEKLKHIIKILDEKQAKDIKLIKISDLTIIADYFVIAGGTSSTQVKMLAEEVENKLAKNGVEPHHIEGHSTGWILLDYNDVVVHVLYGETREFYNLEKLWKDGEVVDIQQYL